MQEVILNRELKMGIRNAARAVIVNDGKILISELTRRLA